MTITKNISVEKVNQENLMFGQRVAYVIDEKGLSKAWIADKLGISKQALNYLLKHSIKPKFIDELAQLLQIEPQWLETGIGQLVISNIKKTEVSLSHLPIKTKLELLKGVDTSNSETIDFSCSNIDSFLAYKLIDDSNFPPFIEGSILIFDKKRTPSMGDYVLIIVNSDVYVRQYLQDGADFCYKASHATHKTFINPNVILLGVLVEARYHAHQPT